MRPEVSFRRFAGILFLGLSVYWLLNNNLDRATYDLILGFYFRYAADIAEQEAQG